MLELPGGYSTQWDRGTYAMTWLRPLVPTKARASPPPALRDGSTPLRPERRPERPIIGEQRHERDRKAYLRLLGIPFPDLGAP